MLFFNNIAISSPKTNHTPYFMKTFLKMLLATLLGGILLIFIGFIVIASLVSMAEPKVVVHDKSILKIDLDNEIRERSDDNPFAAFDPLSREPERALGLNEVLATLKTAATDDKIIGVYLKGGIPLTGHGTLTEIRDALRAFRESGKFVYSYSEIMTQKGYYLVSEADSILMNPGGFFEWRGLNASVGYYKEALDKLGVEPVVLRATDNKYKSAVEPFLGQEMSPENRSQLTALLSSVWNDYLTGIGNARGVEPSQLNRLADSMTVSSPATAVENNLIDREAYEDELLNIFLEKTGKEDFDDIPFISVRRYAESARLGKGGYNNNKIAVIIAQGDIVSGDEGEYKIGSERMAEAIRKARKNDKVKAIVLRVNSPGGSAMASEVIWREMALAREQKPVVVSMGDLAASGGYYIACFADTIVAQPTTITGSIGAFGLFFTGEELMHDKLGINIETVSTNKYSDLGTFDRSLTSNERRILINQVDQIYTTFKKRVAEGRDMEPSYVDSIGGGHVYSGRDALDLGLVDVMGGLNTAIDIARNMADIGDEYRIVEYPEMEDPFMRIMKQLTGDYEEQAIRSRLGEYARYFDMVEKAKAMQGYQTRLEYEIEID